MASNTQNLKLLKKDPVADGNETFNIETMLNDNWDKIDEKVATKEELDNIDVPVKSVNNKTGDVTLSASDVGAETPAGAQAKANTVEQAANEYTNQEVGAVQKQLDDHQMDYSQFKGDLSTLKTTAKDSIPNIVNELFTNVSNGKKIIGGAITDVDDRVNVPAEATFKQLADAIGQIQTGRKWAYGEGTGLTGILEVNGLDFTPRFLMAKFFDNGPNSESKNFSAYAPFRGGNETYNLNASEFAGDTHPIRDLEMGPGYFKMLIYGEKRYRWYAFE
ncbi:hypothetical protein ACW2QC_07415 [Virgibacillus sp. FSP13]